MSRRETEINIALIKVRWQKKQGAMPIKVPEVEAMDRYHPSVDSMPDVNADLCVE